jgi:hypothetical protein
MRIAFHDSITMGETTSTEWTKKRTKSQETDRLQKKPMVGMLKRFSSTD